MKLFQFFSQRKQAEKRISFFFKIFLSVFTFLFLFFSQFIALIVYSDFKDFYLGRLNLSFFIVDAWLLFLGFFWLGTIVILGRRYLKPKSDWLYVFSIPLFFFLIFLLFLIFLKF